MFVSFPLCLDNDGRILDAKLKTITSKSGCLTPWVTLIHGETELEEIMQAIALIKRS